MGKVAYVDMIGGVAGDMLMAAWVDAGVAVEELERALRSVVADGWELVIERVERGGISALHLDLVIPGEDDHAHAPDGTHVHRHPRHRHRLRDILAIVERSGLTRVQIERASAIYRRLAEDEARENGEDADETLFHSVGQIDAILDVAGTCVALDLLEIEDLRCSPFPTGHGQVTLTGRAIVSTLATPGPAPDMTLERVGYGAGRKKFAIPNVVRVTVGQRTT